MDSIAVDSKIVKNWREFPPSSYSLKINKLSELNLEKYESCLFSSGGYDWRLAIFPKGNKEDNGNGHISMYVEIESTASEVVAYLTFFIYNKKENKYFTIHDVEVKRFNALRKMWGLPKVLTSDIFNDPKNGFIFDGEQCEFGVDVVVVSPFNNWEIASFGEKLTRPKFSWSLKKFSVLKEYKYISEQFSMGGKIWAMELYPKGETEVVDKWLSLHLMLANEETLTADEKVYVLANLRLIDPQGSNITPNKINNWYKQTSRRWGWIRFLCLSEVRKTYLDKEDTLIVEVEFEVVSSTKCSPIN